MFRSIIIFCILNTMISFAMANETQAPAGNHEKQENTAEADQEKATKNKYSGLDGLASIMPSTGL